MRTRTLLLIIALVLTVSTAYLIGVSDSTDAATADNVRLFVEDEDGIYHETTVYGTSVREIIEKGCDDLGMTIVYDDLGKIQSVDGIIAEKGTYWNIHQWMPLGTHGWASVGYDEKSDGQLITGTSYCLHMSGQSFINGVNVYGVPDFSPESEGYVFIRFDYGYDSPDRYVQDAFTESDRMNGFWIKGRGSNMGEVVKDAMESNGFQAEFLTKIDSNGNDLQYWINSFFGISGSTQLGENSWAYWSQYMYLNDKWTYNDWTLGYYDPAVYKYVSIVYIISINYSDGSGEERNILNTLPDVTDERSISSMVKTRILNVSFELEGAEIYSATVNYGDVLTYVPDVPEKEGFYFSGWGDTTKPILEDTVFTGRYIPNSGSMHTVRYLDLNGSVIHTEMVKDGDAATYDLVPSKPSTEAEMFRFVGWSTNGTEVISLSSITSDLTLRPVFVSEPRMYTVTFFSDGKIYAERKVAYGTALTDIPAGPARGTTVDKVYSFVGWYIAIYSGPRADEALLADLSCVTASKQVYAAYTYVPHPYTLNVVTSEGTLDFDVVYGGFLTEEMMMSPDGGILLFYRDSKMTQSVGTSFMFSGDTILYAEKIAGHYEYADGSKKEIKVGIDQSVAKQLKFRDGRIIVADVSNFSDGKTVLLDRETAATLQSVFGSDGFIEICLYRGRVSVNIGGLISALDAAGSSDSVAEFSISKGPTTSVRINSSLKHINYDDSFTVSLKVNGRTVSDASLRIILSVPYDKEENNDPIAWSANANTGVLTSISCSYSDGYLSFDASALPYFFVGTSVPRGESSANSDPCPYGDVQYTCDGSTQETYNSTLVRMDIDCGGDLLMVPSSLEGYPLWRIGPDAFLGVTNVSVIVIPATVKEFDWTSLLRISFEGIVFLGDMPTFIGEPPVQAKIYFADKASSWSTSSYFVLNVLTYSMGDFVLQYCLIDNQIVILKWIKGKEVDIPAYVNVNGTEYPVTIIGCNAFEDSSVTHVRIPNTVTSIQTRAFYNCVSLEQVLWGINSEIRVLADECFRGCVKLRSNEDIIPSGTEFIGFETFRDCRMLRKITIPNSVTDMRGGAFYNCIYLSDLVLGNGLIAIPERCFGYCSSLDGVIIPDSVKNIDSNAFYRCIVMKGINLGQVESVGSRAFYDCEELKTVTFGSELYALGIDCFGRTPHLSTVYAYCAQPKGFDTSGISSETELYVNYDVSVNWDVGHNVLEKEDNLKRSFEAKTMPYVMSAIILILAMLAVASWRYKRKMLV